ncbi:MAG: ferredoxin [Planctomycetaceae bacterium]|nr:ferredoxin [Planctomycetaceae bacterium]HAA73171.1 ferredoxin [Planctomycetaceae bacterium]|tara:strand:- start:4698 stop:5111 length:414 start_codon:yes stop_codon:yes gene_type:complete
MPVVKFLKENKEIEVPEGANLRAEAEKAGIHLNCAISGISDGVDQFVQSVSKFTHCRGFGLCGTCRVLVKKGMENTSSLSNREKAKFKWMPIPDPIPSLAYVGNEEEMRLACQTTVNGDIEVESQPPLNLFGENFFS